MPIHGYFTLKTVKSKVMYCLTFSQESLSDIQVHTQTTGNTANLGGPRLIPPVTDLDHLWETYKLVGRKVVNGEMHYKVRWEDTWMPESELAHANDLIDEFEMKLQRVQASRGGGRQKGLEGEDDHNFGLFNKRGDTGQRRRRGRPRKQQ
jgi:hypothetical protein